MRQYTRYRPARRKRWPVGMLAALFLLLGGLWWWLNWQPRQPDRASVPQGSSGRPLVHGSATVRTNLQLAAGRPVASTPPAPRTPSTAPALQAKPPSLPSAADESPPGFRPRPVQSLFEAQLVLARSGISAGALDGTPGSRTRNALRAFQIKNGLPVTGQLDAPTRARLILASPPYTHYTVTTQDLARLQPLGTNWLAKSQQARLDFETILEFASEKGHAHPEFVRKINPTIDWSSVPAGAELLLPNVELPPTDVPAAFARIRLAERTLQVFDAATNLLAHFPCSIARRVEKRPVGELRVVVIAPDPNYTFDPEIFPESPEARALGTRLILPPGPNNPVGSGWIGLDRPGYGIHGTPQPEQVGQEASHGCFRLTNWDAGQFLRLAWIGLPVRVEP